MKWRRKPCQILGEECCKPESREYTNTLRTRMSLISQGAARRQMWLERQVGVVGDQIWKETSYLGPHGKQVKQSAFHPECVGKTLEGWRERSVIWLNLFIKSWLCYYVKSKIWRGQAWKQGDQQGAAPGSWWWLQQGQLCKWKDMVRFVASFC